MLKRFMRKTRMVSSLQDYFRMKRHMEEKRLWETSGQNGPPPLIVKQETLRDICKNNNIKVFVETGTYYGDTTEAMKHFVDRVFTIELSQLLFERAQRRFRNDKKIKLYFGDSGEVLKDVMQKINQPALFWLDGHYSGGLTAKGEKITPIFKELSHILQSSETSHIIVIDDARCFGKSPGYPTIEELKEFIFARRSHLTFTVQDDSIRIVPAG